MTTTTDTVTAVNPIVEAGGNFYQVDALVAAYGEILEQAKRQLESFEPSEAEFRKISEAVAERINYRELSYQAVSTMTNDNASYQGTQALEVLVQRINERLDERRIRQLIRGELENIVCDRFTELKSDVKRMIENQLNEERRTVERQNYELQTALKTIFSTVLLDPLRSEVRHQMDAITAARAASQEQS
jgi:hypothetical protein